MRQNRLYRFGFRNHAEDRMADVPRVDLVPVRYGRLAPQLVGTIGDLVDPLAVANGPIVQ